MTDKTITPPQVNQPKGSGSLEFDGLLAAFHAIVWATAEDDDPDLAYDEAGNVEAKKLQAMYRALQSELTKAREELNTLKDEVWHALDNSTEDAQTDDVTFYRPDFVRLCELVSEEWHEQYHNQSAPADKGHANPEHTLFNEIRISEPVNEDGEPVACAHGIRAPHACDQCEAQNAVPDYWEDPDTGTCIDQWTKIQGLNGTEAYTIPLYRHAEQPAPVAVVMPGRLAIQSHWPEWKISGSEGWNACLDEVARLNSEPKP